MDDQAYMGVPLIGALLIEQGLITMEQLQVCMLLQSENYLGIPIGQILVNCGYITQNDLTHILILQSEIRSSLLETFDSRIEPPADLSALLVYQHHALALIGLLRRLGVATTVARDWDGAAATRDRQPPDMLLIDPCAIAPDTELAAGGLPLLVLPSALCVPGRAGLPAWAEAALGPFIAQVRERRQHQETLAALRQREFELTAITTMNQIFISVAPPHEALSQLMIRIRDLLHVEAGILYRLDRAAGQLIAEVIFGPGSNVPAEQRISIRQGVAGWAARFRKPLVIADVAHDPRFNPQIDQLPGCTTRSVLCVPLMAFGEVRGVIQLMNKLHGERFTKRDLFLLRAGATTTALTQALAAR